MSAMYINYGSFNDWATKIDNHNTNLKDDLTEIKRLINSSEGDWESNAAVTTREKITAMEPRFEQYHDVVANYATFLRNIASAYKSIEDMNNSNAQAFV